MNNRSRTTSIHKYMTSIAQFIFAIMICCAPTVMCHTEAGSSCAIDCITQGVTCDSCESYTSSSCGCIWVIAQTQENCVEDWFGDMDCSAVSSTAVAGTCNSLQHYVHVKRLQHPEHVYDYFIVFPLVLLLSLLVFSCCVCWLYDPTEPSMYPEITKSKPVVSFEYEQVPHRNCGVHCGRESMIVYPYTENTF